MLWDEEVGGIVGSKLQREKKKATQRLEGLRIPLGASAGTGKNGVEGRGLGTLRERTDTQQDECNARVDTVCAPRRLSAQPS